MAEPAGRSRRMAAFAATLSPERVPAKDRNPTRSGRSLPSVAIPAHASLPAIPLSIEQARLGGKCSFDDPIGARQERLRCGETERLASSVRARAGIIQADSCPPT